MQGKMENEMIVVSCYSIQIRNEHDMGPYEIIWLMEFRFTCLLHNSRHNAYPYWKIYVSEWSGEKEAPNFYEDLKWRTEILPSSKTPCYCSDSQQCINHSNT